jgi:hypothetical protein
MTTKLLAGVLLIPLVTLVMVVSADYAVVDVREGGPDGMRLIIPVPLALARFALSFAPEEAQYIQVPEISDYIPAIQRAIEELRAARDGVLVSVEERNETVLIQKLGEKLRIDVDDGGEQVHVTVPLDAVGDMLEQYDGEGFRTKDLIRSVGQMRGKLVHVRGDDEEVKVWVW